MYKSVQSLEKLVCNFKIRSHFAVEIWTDHRFLYFFCSNDDTLYNRISAHLTTDTPSPILTSGCFLSQRTESTTGTNSTTPQSSDTPNFYSKGKRLGSK